MNVGLANQYLKNPDDALLDIEHRKIPTSLLNELWEELLIERGTCWATVVSNSMYPLIKKDDHVKVEKIHPGLLRFGDIVVFRKYGQLVIHRVIGQIKFVGKCYFIENGDANHQPGLVSEDDIVGQVTSIRKSKKTIDTINISGRFLQIGFGCISYGSLKLLSILKYFSIYGKKLTSNHRFIRVFDMTLRLIQKLLLVFCER